MVGRTGVEYEDVIKAINVLKKQKLNITVDNVRFTLGTGSKTTIARYLRQWRGKNKRAAISVIRARCGTTKTNYRSHRKIC